MNSENWIVYSVLLDTGLHNAVGEGKYIYLKDALGAAYMDIQEYVDSLDDDLTFKITTLNYLEGGEDLYFDVYDSKNHKLFTYYFLKVYNK